MRLSLQKKPYSYRKSGFLHIQCISACVIPFWKKIGYATEQFQVIFLGPVVHHFCSSYRCWKHKQHLPNFSKCQLYSDNSSHQTYMTATQIHLPRSWAWKVKPEFLKRSHHHINDLSSPQRTNPLPQTGDLTIRAFLKKEKFLLVLIICDLQLNF